MRLSVFEEGDNGSDELFDQAHVIRDDLTRAVHLLDKRQLTAVGGPQVGGELHLDGIDDARAALGLLLLGNRRDRMDRAVQHAELHVGESVEFDKNLLSGADLSEAGRRNLHAPDDGQLPVGNHRCDHLARRDVLVAAPVAL